MDKSNNNLQKSPGQAEPSQISVGKVERKAWVLTLLMVIASFIFKSLHVTMGIALGGVLAILNYYWLKKFVLIIFEKKKGKVTKISGFLYFFKYVITGAIIFIVIKYKIVNVFGLLAGLLVIIIAITIEGMAKMSILRKEE